jgi:hypothetical protein
MSMAMTIGFGREWRLAIFRVLLLSSTTPLSDRIFSGSCPISRIIDGIARLGMAPVSLHSHG